MVRKTATKIDPVTVAALALKSCKCKADYHRIGQANSRATMDEAWLQLSSSEQQHVTDICNGTKEPNPQVIADELSACGTLIQLQGTKSNYGELAVKAAWKLLSTEERSRLSAICKNEPPFDKAQGPQEETEVVTEKPTVYLVEPQQPTRKPNLIELTSDLQQLDNLLDNLNGEDIPADIQVAVDDLLAQREETNDLVLDKLDNYCGLIQSRLLWAADRKSESDRLAKLAESDTKVVEFLRSRLKSHLEATDQKKLRTKRFNISVCANGGKTPLRFDDTTPEQMPERFQRVVVEPNRDAIRSALEQGEDLQFAYLGEREHHLRIK